MTAASRTFTFRGHRIRTTTPRTYVVVTVSSYDHKARIQKRSDNIDTARKFKQSYGGGIVDMRTGEEIA